MKNYVCMNPGKPEKERSSLLIVRFIIIPLFLSRRPFSCFKSRARTHTHNVLGKPSSKTSWQRASFCCSLYHCSMGGARLAFCYHVIVLLIAIANSSGVLGKKANRIDG